MAWNQPGGNGGRDPWGDRGGQQGPPDLDEVLKKLQSKLARIFGGRGPGGGGRMGRGIGPGGGAVGLGVLAGAALLVWALLGIYIVDPAEQAVVQRFGKYVRTTSPGPHWAPPLIEKFEKVNVQEIRSQDIGFRRQGTGKSAVPNEALMLTEDENVIDIQFTVQYRVKDAPAFLFNVVEPELTLRAATESAVREIVGRNGMDYVITDGRDAIAAEVERLIQEILDLYEAGLFVTSVNMQDAQPPAQVQDAFFDAIKAREDQERIINEANAYKADVVPKARGEATAVLQRAEGYRQSVIAQAEGESARFVEVLSEYRKAPEVTRERLYIEAVEAVMANTSKVLVDVTGGNNLMYLPLDRLMDRGDGVRRAESSGSSAGNGDSSRSTFESTRRSRENLGGRSR